MGPPIWLMNRSSVRHNRQAPASSRSQEGRRTSCSHMQLQSTQGRASIEPRATDCRLGRAREGEMRDARCEMRDVIVCCDDAW